MCHFFSAILTKSGDLLSAPEYTDSHEDLIAHYDLRDSGVMGAGGRDWVRLEFLPPSAELIGDLSKWQLTLDEESVPDWYDAEKARELCAARVERMIIREDRKILMGGPWIILAGKIGKVFGRVRLASKGADLRGANLYGANLSGANLSGANLSGADLSGADLYSANLSGADLYSANLCGANLYGANLSGANLSGANLSGADLYSANLSGANLSGATLCGANLYSANLCGANLSGANLSGANLRGADLLASDPVPDGWARTDAGILTRK